MQDVVEYNWEIFNHEIPQEYFLDENDPGASAYKSLQFKKRKDIEEEILTILLEVPGEDWQFNNVESFLKNSALNLTLLQLIQKQNDRLAETFLGDLIEMEEILYEKTAETHQDETIKKKSKMYQKTLGRKRSFKHSDKFAQTAPSSKWMDETDSVMEKKGIASQEYLKNCLRLKFPTEDSCSVSMTGINGFKNLENLLKTQPHSDSLALLWKYSFHGFKKRNKQISKREILEMSFKTLMDRRKIKKLFKTNKVMSEFVKEMKKQNYQTSKTGDQIEYLQKIHQILDDYPPEIVASAKEEEIRKGRIRGISRQPSTSNELKVPKIKKETSNEFKSNKRQKIQSVPDSKLLRSQEGRLLRSSKWSKNS